ncbi:MAG TPA: hypothetical protein VE843_07715, partial [Ktedonobacteraceae bacterium]|nr:hypothetical protein [Ktedonobacteraceae bacterium]
CLPTVVVAHQMRFQTIHGNVATGNDPNCWAKEVRDMDAGPSHSRRVVFACLLAGLFYSSSSMVAG